MRLINYLRNKFHPLFFLFQFKIIRILLSKIKIKFYLKSKKFGNLFIYLPRNINYLLNSEYLEKNTFDFISELNSKKNIKDSLFVDVGGNIGAYSLFFKKNYNSKIFIFEPDDDNLILLFNTKVRNKLEDFHIFPFGLSKENHIASFLIDNISGSTGTLSDYRNIPQIRQKLSKKKNIIALKLDLFSEIIENVTWIKMDVEGYELEVLKGMMKIITLNTPNLIIESNEEQILPIIELLKPINYNIKKMDNNPNYIFYKS